MKAVLRNILLCTLCLASIVLAAPHQSNLSEIALKGVTCRLKECPPQASQCEKPASAVMHESAARLYW